MGDLNKPVLIAKVWPGLSFRVLIQVQMRKMFESICNFVQYLYLIMHFRYEVNVCCKYFTFSIMSFFGYQSFAQLRVVQTSHSGVTAVHSGKDR
jgi:hypothetical protein